MLRLSPSHARVMGGSSHRLDMSRTLARHPRSGVMSGSGWQNLFATAAGGRFPGSSAASVEREFDSPIGAPAARWSPASAVSMDSSSPPASSPALSFRGSGPVGVLAGKLVCRWGDSSPALEAIAKPPLESKLVPRWTPAWPSVPFFHPSHPFHPVHP